MKLLLDANISWRLIPKLKIHFDDCLHVDYMGLLPPIKDTEIWTYALIKQLIIVTNDNDFLYFSNLKGFPPKIVLIKTGNQSNHFIESLLIKHKPEIEALNATFDYGLLEIY